MAHSFIVENGKTLRQALDMLNIVVKDNGTTILTFTRDDIISCVLSLRGVDTKLDGPELEASTIEFEAYYTGSESDLLSMRGKDTVIEYQCGYNDGDVSIKRTFYASFDSDGIKLDRHVLRIKGTDYVGTVTGQNSGKLVMQDSYFYEFGRLGDVIDMYVYNVAKPFLTSLYPPSPGVITPTGVYAGTPDMYILTDSPTESFMPEYYTLIEPESKRKLLAAFCNIFRGCDPNNPSKFAKKFVFRDAGIPGAGWCDDAVSNWQNTFAGSSLNTWALNYNDLTDVRVEYGNTVKTVRIDNPNIDADGTVFETYSFKDNMSTFIETEFPAKGLSVSWEPGSPLTFTAERLSPYTCKVTSSGTGSADATVSYQRIVKKYDPTEDSPNIEIATGNTNGDVITLEPFYGLHKVSGWDRMIRPYPTPDYVDISIVEEALTCALNDCNMKQPRWIEFTWRGHPDMQPRDMILLTEADGTTQNYYEIDSLTLEHRDGGLTSNVKALYKCEYIPNRKLLSSAGPLITHDSKHIIVEE